MSFNSFQFAVFLPVVLTLYWSLRRSVRSQNALLLAASYVFYGYWDWRFLSLLLVSTVIDYGIALRIERERDAAGGTATAVARRWLTLSLATNLGILGFFKYFNFFAASFAALLESIGLRADPVYLSIVLPVGISFYTFQTLSYTVDVYRGEMRADRSLLSFAVYVAFFPQLVAGPIERARIFLPQISSARHFDRSQFADGLHLIFWGMFMKVYVADNLAPFVNEVFASSDPSGFNVLLASYAFAFQIYGDFAGYSNVARGCAKCMGMELMVNFRHPYVSQNPSEFWRRWHISLSTWLRDYLYVPLGGNRLGPWLTNRNLAITMLLGGLWHGATWLFVLWGAYQGFLLVVHRATARQLARFLPEAGWQGAAVRLAKVVVMFQFVCVGWLIFRGESTAQISRMLSALLTWTGTTEWETALPLLTFVLPLVMLEGLLGLRQTDALHRARWIPTPARAGAYGVLFYLLAFHGAASQTFIYFQF